MTNVKFYKELNGILAVFPDIIASYNGYRPDNITCYSHIGQHSAMHPDYLKGKREANFNEYCHDLLPELIGQGYKDLNILNSQEIECHRPPTRSEVFFGDGATHYRAFTIGEIGITKKGKLKQWFVSPDDKLRYYTR